MGGHVTRTQRRARLFPRIRLKPFRKDRTGAVALEFAMVATPFFWLMMGLAEIGMIFVVQTDLDYAMMETARQIRTGQVQEGGVSAGDVRERVCDRMNAILDLDCDTNLFVDVRSYPNFGALAAPDPGEDNSIDQSEMSFDPGAPGEVVLVRGFYKWRMITPVISKTLVDFGSNSRLITSATLFRNEPYATETATGTSS